MLIRSFGGAATTDRTQHRGQNTDALCLSYVSCYSDRHSSRHNDWHELRVYSVATSPSPSKLLQIAGLACLLVRGFGLRGRTERRARTSRGGPQDDACCPLSSRREGLQAV